MRSSLPSSKVTQELMLELFFRLPYSVYLYLMKIVKMHHISFLKEYDY
jgi:hypothetical protein